MCAPASAAPAQWAASAARTARARAGGDADHDRAPECGVLRDCVVAMRGVATLWTRPGLDMKTRALICVVSDTATHAWPELAIHLRMARRKGWSEEELAEALLHLSGYVGLPAVREALIVAKRVFAEMRAEPGGGLG